VALVIQYKMLKAILLHILSVCLWP